MKKLFTQFGFILLMAIVMFPNKLKAENGQMLFVAEMSGFYEVPIANSDAKGLITFLLSEDRKEVFIHGVFNGLSGPVKTCQIHLAYYDTTGPMILDISSLVSGNRIKGAIPVSSNLLYAYAASQQIYVEVTTTDFPNGEIRGQLYLESDYILPVFARSANEVPPVSNPAASGFGAIRISENITRIDYQFLSVSLSGPVVSVDIHSGFPGANGPVIASLNASDLSAGSIETSTIVEDIFYYAATTGAYINVKTAANPDGEIRGQIQFDWPNNAMALLNGDQETPPVTTTAKAFGYASLDLPNLDSITYAVVYTGITPTAAHIHNGKAGVPGGVIIPLKASSIPGLYSGRAAIKDVDLTSFLKDELYFNIHSAAHGAGEIRGQIENNLLKAFAFDLCGDQEAPKTTSNGYGAAYVSVNKSNTELNYGILVDGLTGPATSAHIHDGAFGVNGNVLIGLDAPAPDFYDYLPITGLEASKIDLDGAYMNVHTDANPNGEIRGQVRRSLSCSINVATVESAIQDISISNTLVRDLLILKANSDRNVAANVYVSDISGKRMMQFQQTKFVSGSNAIPLDVDRLSSGFYLLNVVDENKSVRSFKFVKQ